MQAPQQPGNPVHEPRLKGLLTQTPQLEFFAPCLQPGDLVLVKSWKDGLQPSWEGTYQVLLTAETEVKMAEKGWTHYTRVKKLKDLGTKQRIGQCSTWLTNLYG